MSCSILSVSVSYYKKLIKRKCWRFCLFGTLVSFLLYQIVHLDLRQSFTPSPLFNSHTSTKQASSSQSTFQPCRHLQLDFTVNEPIQPWTSSNRYTSLVQELSSCFFTSSSSPLGTTGAMARAQRNILHWTQSQSNWNANSSDDNHRLETCVDFVDFRILPLEQLLLDHTSAVKVSEHAGNCHLPQYLRSEENKSSSPFLISCNGAHTVQDCVKKGLATAGPNANVTVWMLDDRPCPLKRDWEDESSILHDGRISRIFAVNPSVVHPKIRPYPIGVHSADRWIPHLNGREAHWTQRTNLLECGGVTLTHGRREKRAQLERNGLICGDPYYPSDTYIERILHSKFVWSPLGRGIQCFREWEIWLGGAVPVMDAPPPTHQQTGLYDRLPMVLVHNWSDVTHAFLEEAWHNIQQRAQRGEYDMRRIYFVPYWFQQILM